MSEHDADFTEIATLCRGNSKAIVTFTVSPSFHSHCELAASIVVTDRAYWKRRTRGKVRKTTE